MYFCVFTFLYSGHYLVFLPHIIKIFLFQTVFHNMYEKSSKCNYQKKPRIITNTY